MKAFGNRFFGLVSLLISVLGLSLMLLFQASDSRLFPLGLICLLFGLLYVLINFMDQRSDNS